eukprot:scaffold16942_cov118-Isochrysis_galbana.AAC.6
MAYADIYSEPFPEHTAYADAHRYTEAFDQGGYLPHEAFDQGGYPPHPQYAEVDPTPCGGYARHRPQYVEPPHYDPAYPAPAAAPVVAVQLYPPPSPASRPAHLYHRPVMAQTLPICALPSGKVHYAVAPPAGHAY